MIGEKGKIYKRWNIVIGNLVKYRYYIFSFLVFLILSGIIYFVLFKKVDSNSILVETKFIGHAFYGIEKKDYSNSVESLVLGYNNGIRVMEADFLFASDGKLVLNHYWESGSWEESTNFLNKKVYGSYTPMDIDDLLKYMEKYDDLYIMIDTKEDEYDNGKTILDVYREIVDVTKNYNEDLLDRFIVQIYNCENYEEIMNIYEFKNRLVSIYKMYPLNIYYVLYFCLKNNIEAIALPYWYIEDGTITYEQIEIIKSKNIKVFVHTINDEVIYKNLLELGVDGVYTDFLN